MKIRQLLLAIYAVLMLPNCKPNGGKGTTPPTPENSPPDIACTLPSDPYEPVDLLRLKPLILSIEPHDTDEAITSGDLHRYVPALGSRQRDLLFVWLPGTGAETQEFQNILGVAAYAGYRSISLAYKNNVTVNRECGCTESECESSCKPDYPDCELEVRREIVYGANAQLSSLGFDSPCVDVSRADSIENRLLRLLQKLNEDEPSLGLEGFYDGESVRWDKIVIAGWSQGGGHAGIIAKDYEVARAVYVSKGAGAVAQNGMPVPVPWASLPRQTGPEREFAMVHSLETAWCYSPALFDQWGLKQFGDFVDIDGTNPKDAASFNCSHLVTTRAMPLCGSPSGEDPNCTEQGDDGAYHPSMALDRCMATVSGESAVPPTDEGEPSAGEPILAPVYHYFLTVDMP